MKTIKPRYLIILILFQVLLNLSFSKGDDFFSIIILPDTQYYTSRFPDMIFKQMNWIVENKNPLKIQYAVHMGDITDNNKEYAWKVASSAYNILENAGIPYSIVSGDNDMKNPEKNDYDGIRHTEFLNKYFPVSRFDKPKSWWSGGFFEPGKIDNYYCLFQYKSFKYLILNLEIAPRTMVLNWAKDIALQNDSRKVILVTHDYLDRNGKRLDDLKSFGLNGRDDLGKLNGNNADAILKKLIRKSPNIFLVLCGHKNGTYQKTITVEDFENPDIKRKVIEILSDFQDEKLEGTGEKSGKGLLRVLKIYPEKNEIVIFTVSALTGEMKGKEIHLFME